MKSFALAALLGCATAVQINDWYDAGFEEINFDSDKTKHNYFTAKNGKTYDLAQHGKLVSSSQFDNSMLQTGDNFDNGFEEIDLAQGEKKSKYFTGKNGKTYDLANGKEVHPRFETFEHDEANVLLNDYYDKNLPEDAFEDDKAKKPVKKADDGGLYMASNGKAYDHKTGQEVDLDEIAEVNHVQIGEPIGIVMAKRNLLQLDEDWLAAREDYRIEHNLPEKQDEAPKHPEGIYNTVVRI